MHYLNTDRLPVYWASYLAKTWGAQI